MTCGCLKVLKVLVLKPRKDRKMLRQIVTILIAAVLLFGSVVPVAAGETMLEQVNRPMDDRGLLAKALRKAESLAARRTAPQDDELTDEELREAAKSLGTRGGLAAAMVIAASLLLVTGIADEHGEQRFSEDQRLAMQLSAVGLGVGAYALLSQ